MSRKLAAKLQTGIVARKSDDGATAVEYGLLVALIAAVIVATVGLLGQAILGAFETVLDEL
jgi:pilus assembly protein Flp/PilA